MNTNTWLKTNIIVKREQVELLCQLLEIHEPVSISLSNPDHDMLCQLSPGEMPLWQQTEISILWPADVAVHAILQHVEMTLGQALDITYSILADQDWVRLTEQSFTASQFGNALWVYPRWQAPTLSNPGQPQVIIEPGLAFGTGRHATTQLCLTWLAEQNLQNLTVIDYGCGSGVLALAALAMGARCVWAVDHDRQALDAAFNNAKLNAYVTSENLKIVLPQELSPGLQVDVIIANILAKPLCELADYFYHSLRRQGTIVLSGILATEIHSIKQAYAAFSIQDICQIEEWLRISAIKNY